MKKMLALLLVLGLMFMQVAYAEGGIDTTGIPRFKIAFGYGNWESLLGVQFQESVEYLSKEFNCDLVFFSMGSGDDSIAATESLLAAGDIDAVLSVSWDTARMQVADKYGVPVVTACQFPSAQEIDAVAGYPTFLGGVVDDERWAGYQAMKALYDAGCRNVTISGLTPGYAQGQDERVAGAKQFAEETPDLTIVTESYSLGTYDADVATFVAAFPEMDGMWFTSLSDAIYNAMETEGIADGSVKVAGPDVHSRTGEFFERGIQVWSCGGQYATAMIGWTLLYNYLVDGTKIIEDPTKAIERSYLEVKSYEEFKAYEAIIGSGEYTYTAQELSNLIHHFNPDASFDDYVALGQSYSLQDVEARHAK